MFQDKSSANKTPKKSFLGKIFGGAQATQENASSRLLDQQHEPVKTECLTIVWIRKGGLEVKVSDGTKVFEAVLEQSAYQSEIKPAVGVEVEIVDKVMRRIVVQVKWKANAKTESAPPPRNSNVKPLYGT